MEDKEGDEPGEEERMKDSEPCPFFAGFSAEGKDGGYTGEIKQHKEHKRKGRERREAGGTNISAI